MRKGRLVMRGKKLGLALFIIGVIAVSVGCSIDQEERHKKVILEQDVREALKKEEKGNIEVQQLDFQLKEGDFFRTSFYNQGEIFGYIDKGIGASFSESIKDHPLGGSMKPYLYKIGNDHKLMETSKEIIVNPYGSELIGKNRFRIEPNIYRVDYTKEDIPQIDLELTEVVKRGGINRLVGINEYKIDEQTHYIGLMYSVPRGGSVLYFYDVLRDKFYTRENFTLNEHRIIYVDELKSFIGIDKDLKSYKVVFNKHTYDFEEYIDFNEYIKRVEKPLRMNIKFINNEEALLIEYRELAQGKDCYNECLTFETGALSTFNFKTNEFKEILVADADKHIIVNIVGKVPGLTGTILVIDEFKLSGSNLNPLTRSFKTLNEGKLATLYKEDIQDEGSTANPYISITVSDVSSELFLQKDITQMKERVIIDEDYSKDDKMMVQTTVDFINKKYIFK